MTRILLIEDDQSLGATLSERLGRECTQVRWARTITEAETFLAKEKFSLLIVDLMLPDGSGFDLVERLRKTNQTAVIFLTAMAGPEYRLKGYELGACEYIPKPFHLKELLLLVKRHLPDCIANTPDNLRSQKLYRIAGLTVDYEAMSVSLELSEAGESQVIVEYPAPNDFRLIKLLIEAAPRVLDRAEILSEIWRGEEHSNARTVDNAVVRLRQLLKPQYADHIRSVRGVGYQWLENIAHT